MNSIPTNMKTVAFIPIKLNNQRFPGKNTKKFDDGTPLVHLIQRTLIELKEEGIIDEIYIFCSSDEIKPFILDGIKYYKRPGYLDGFDVLGRQIYTSFVEAVDSDIYVLAHATSPFVSKAHIKECILNVKSGKYDSAFCAQKLLNFLWKDNKPMNFDVTNPIRTQDLEPIYLELSTPYVFTKECFQKYSARTGTNPYICECKNYECIDIDYQEDFDLANKIYPSMIREDDT